MVTLNDFTGNPDRFRAVLDGNAVPRFVERYAGSMHDFKKQPDGSYSVSTDIRDGQPTDERILELDSRLAPVREHRTVGLVDTDFHESIFLPGGHKILMAYEPRQDGSGLVDSVIEEQDAAGDAGLHLEHRGPRRPGRRAGLGLERLRPPQLDRRARRR